MIFKNYLIKNISNIPGRVFKKKIIVFLVDDWGSVRIADKASQKGLAEKGVDVISNRFNKYDTLESPDDLSALFEVLHKNKDHLGNPAVFTGLSVVANPDFDRIEENEFQEYYFEPLDKTFSRYFGDSKCLEIYRQGMEEGIFNPQFHGREHLNVATWMNALRKGDKNLLAAFKSKTLGIPPDSSKGNFSNYLTAFDFQDVSEISLHSDICASGIAIFKQLFRESPDLFTSSGLIHHPSLEGHLARFGIQFIDKAKFSIEPKGNHRYKKRFHYLGQKNKVGQSYITRNCMFEPNDPSEKNPVTRVMREIDSAFRWKKPAIISSHRVNFVGGLDENNRKSGLAMLDSLLKEIFKKWPDVQFMSFKTLAKQF